MAETSVAQRAASTWARLSDTSPIVGAIDTLLRGIGQVMFQNNPLTGLLFLAGILVNSVKLGGMALLGVVASTAAAYLLRADRGLVRNGLFGFNGVLVGIGLAVFLEFNALLLLYVVLGAVVSAVVMMALANFLSVWDTPALTAPFVLTAWMLLFAVYQFGFLQPTALILPLIPEPNVPVLTDLRELPTGGGAVGLTVPNLANALFRGVGEVMFQDNLWTGLIFLIAILVNSRVSAAFALAGSALGLLTALALGGGGIAIYHGLYGFNAVLTAIALGGLFFLLTWRSTVYALVAAIFSTIVFGAIAVALAPIGMPALTAPFVLAAWLFLLPKAGFAALRPVPLAAVTTPERIRADETVGRRPPGPTPEQGPAN